MDGIAKRIEILISDQQSNPSGFAKAVGVSPSVLSHILHGRNKPSLDLILKIHDAFPKVDLEWLLTGGSTSQTNVDTKNDRLPPLVQNTPNGKRIIILNSDGTFEEFRSVSGMDGDK